MDARDELHEPCVDTGRDSTRLSLSNKADDEDDRLHPLAWGQHQKAS